MVGSETDRMHVFPVLLQAVVLIEQGKSVLGFKEIQFCAEFNQLLTSVLSGLIASGQLLSIVVTAP